MLAVSEEQLVSRVLHKQIKELRLVAAQFVFTAPPHMHAVHPPVVGQVQVGQFPQGTQGVTREGRDVVPAQINGCCMHRQWKSDSENKQSTCMKAVRVSNMGGSPPQGMVSTQHQRH